MPVPRRHVQTRRLALIHRRREHLPNRNALPLRNPLQVPLQLLILPRAGEVEQIVDLVLTQVRRHPSYSVGTGIEARWKWSKSSSCRRRLRRVYRLLRLGICGLGVSGRMKILAPRAQCLFLVGLVRLRLHLHSNHQVAAPVENRLSIARAPYIYMVLYT